MLLFIFVLMYCILEEEINNTFGQPSQMLVQKHSKGFLERERLVSLCGCVYLF